LGRYLCPSVESHLGDNLAEMWDDQDGFDYNVLRLPGDASQRLKVLNGVDCCLWW
jgi:hypothetical protein